jgi:heme-based aerotactic transducer
MWPFSKKRGSQRTYPPGTIDIRQADHRDKLMIFGITEADLGIIKYWGDLFLPRLDEAVDGFYKRLEANPVALKLLNQFSNIERQKPLLRAHLASMLAGVIDDKYIENRAKVGRVHESINLNTSLYLGQYELMRKIIESWFLDSDATIEDRYIFSDALTRVISFDVSLVLDSLEIHRQEKIVGMAGEATGFIESFDEAARKLAANDLNARLESVSGSQFESTANNLNQALETFQHTLKQIGDTAHQDLRQGSQFVSAAANDVSVSVGRVEESSANAKDRIAMAKEHLENSSRQTKALADASDNITNVLGVILEIAEQTKLLSLNATIEAARSGDAGKGFAVVASEVKQLANQTNKATEGIRDLVEAIQRNTHLTVENLSTFVKFIEEIDQIISEVGVASDEIIQTSGQMQNSAQSTAQAVTKLQDLLGQFKGIG